MRTGLPKLTTAELQKRADDLFSAGSPAVMKGGVIKSPEERNKKWDLRFLRLAREVSTWSKDPSTQVGCVIVRPDKTVASLGYNGFPKSVPDDPELLANREAKYKIIIHSEINAIIAALEPLEGYTIYTYPFPPCSNCASAFVQAGIARAVAIRPTEEQYERWGESLDFAVSQILNKANVPITYYDASQLDVPTAPVLA